MDLICPIVGGNLRVRIPASPTGWIGHDQNTPHPYHSFQLKTHLSNCLLCNSIWVSAKCLQWKTSKTELQLSQPLAQALGRCAHTVPTGCVSGTADGTETLLRPTRSHKWTLKINEMLHKDSRSSHFNNLLDTQIHIYVCTCVFYVHVSVQMCRSLPVCICLF